MGTQISSVIPDGDIRNSHTQEEFLHSMSSQNPKNSKPISKTILDVPKSYKNFVIVTTGAPDHVKYWQEKQIFVCAFTIMDPPINLNYYHMHSFKGFSLVTIHLGKVSYQNMIFFMNRAKYNLSKSEFLNQIIGVATFYENNSDFNDKVSKCIEPKLTIASPKVAKLSLVANNDNDESTENQYYKNFQKESLQDSNQEYSIIKHNGNVELSDNLDQLSETSSTPADEGLDVDEHQLVISVANSSSITLSTNNSSEVDSSRQSPNKKQRKRKSPLKKRKDPTGSFSFSEDYNDGYNDNEPEDIDIQPVSKKKPKASKNSKKSPKIGQTNKSKRKPKRKTAKINIIEDGKRNNINSGSLSEGENNDNPSNKRNLEFNIIEDRKNNNNNPSNKRNLEFNIIEDRKNNNNPSNKRNLEFNIIEDRKNDRPNNAALGEDNANANSKSKPRNLEINIIEDRKRDLHTPTDKKENSKKPIRKSKRKHKNNNKDNNDDHSTDNSNAKKGAVHSEGDPLSSNNLQSNNNQSNNDSQANNDIQSDNGSQSNDNVQSNNDSQANNDIQSDNGSQSNNGPQSGNDLQSRDIGHQNQKPSTTPIDSNKPSQDPSKIKNDKSVQADQDPLQFNNSSYQNQYPFQRNRDLPNQYPNNRNEYPNQQEYYPNQGNTDKPNQYPYNRNGYPNQQEYYPNQGNADKPNQYPYNRNEYPNQKEYYPNQGNTDKPNQYPYNRNEYPNQKEYYPNQGNTDKHNQYPYNPNGYPNHQDPYQNRNSNPYKNQDSYQPQNRDPKNMYPFDQGGGNNQPNHYPNQSNRDQPTNDNHINHYPSAGNSIPRNGNGNYGNGNDDNSHGNGNNNNYGDEYDDDRISKPFINRIQPDSQLDHGTGNKFYPNDNNLNNDVDDNIPASQRGVEFDDPNKLNDDNDSDSKKIRKLRSVSPSRLPNSKRKPSPRSPKNSVTVNFSITGQNDKAGFLDEEEEEEEAKDSKTDRAIKIGAKPKISVSNEMFEFASPQKSIYFEISADNFNYSKDNVHRDPISISTPIIFDSRLKHKKKATLNLAHKVVVDKYHKKKSISIGHVVEISKYSSHQPSLISELKERAVSLYSTDQEPEEEQVGTQTNNIAGVEYAIDSSVFDEPIIKKKPEISDHKSPSNHHHHRNNSKKKDKEKSKKHSKRSHNVYPNDEVKSRPKDDDDLSVFDMEMSEAVQNPPSTRFIKQQEKESDIDVNYVFGSVNDDASSDAFAPARKNNRIQVQLDQECL